MRDGLTPVLEKCDAADALIIGSPMYFHNLTGETRSFMERLLFRYLVYDKPPRTLAPSSKPVALVLTMNVTDEMLPDIGYTQTIDKLSDMIGRIFGGGKAAEVLLATDTYQFPDYSRYVAPRFDPVHKLKRKEEQFPLELEKAHALGVKLGKPQ
eukprot:TRINITY_DN498_c0_g1_i4.p2 TRINITY_DN498_c0_g1~~TRINITY_DN498_c0_g1_i4.p2  ORF type:complete len:154 (+),score=55.55 TRINITY_DN498_c0_g1_i4:184-645(+)